MDELVDLSAVEQRSLLASRKVSARELLDAHLRRIEQVNPTVNAVVAMDPAVAQGRAAAVDESISRGDDPGLLAGLVTAHKDLADTADFVTTYGSPLHVGNRPAADELLVARMKAAGAVALGKTNTPEHGAGSHTFNTVYGTTLNPWDTTRSAGGSSGGAAVALATGMVAIADGSDMGGSLRNPAAWNGIVGLRPSPGLVPDEGAANGWNTLSVLGPMGRTVADVHLLLQALAGPHPLSPLPPGAPIPASLPTVSTPLRVALSPTLGGLPMESEIVATVEAVGRSLAGHGWHVELAEPDFRGMDECFEVLRSWSFANDLVDPLGDRAAALKAVIRDEAERGRALSGADVARATARLTRQWRRAAGFFADYDVLIAPVTQLHPFPATWEYPNEVAGEAMDRYITWMRSCSRVTTLGTPALSVPAGWSAGGLPIGVQLVAGHGRDVELLAIGQAVESLLGAGGRRPPIVQQ